MLVALWSPVDPDSALLLARLEAEWERHGSQGVQPVAICLSEDSSAAKTFAIGDQLHYPVVHDWGTSHGPRLLEASPVAIAYGAEHLPRLVVTDRRHRVRTIIDGLYTYEGTELDGVLSERLEEEPD